MPVVKLSLTDEYYQKLKEMADAEFMSMQDYIRNKIFQEKTIFTPEEAVKRAHDGRFSNGQEFSLPDIFDDDWDIERSLAGVFGKRFYNYVMDNDCGIEFVNMGKHGRRAMYQLKEVSRNE